MTRIAARIRSLAAGGGCLLAMPALAHADCGIDQEQPLIGSYLMLVGEWSPGQRSAGAQTFVVGATGLLAEIRLYGGLSVESPPTGFMLLQIFPTVDGVPDESDEPILREEVPFSTMPPPGSVGEFGVDVSQHTRYVGAGQALAIVLRVPSGTFRWHERGNDRYPGGQSMARPEPAGEWSAHSTLDAFFKTVVCTATAVEEGVAARSWSETKAPFASRRR